MTGLLGYSLAAGVMLAAGLWLLLRRGQSEPARHAAIAAIVSAGWAWVLAFRSHDPTFSPWAVFAADGLRIAAWFVALESLATGFTRGLRRTVLFLSIAMALSAAVAALLGATPADAITWLLAALGFAAAVSALVATLHVWRHAVPAAAREIRWCVAGAAAQFGCDALHYAQLDITSGVQALMMLRAAVVLLAVAPLARSVWRLPTPEPRVFVSRQVAYYTTTILVLCLYLGLTTLAAWLAREHGGAHGAALQAAVIVIALASLIAFLLAEWPLRRLRVFIATHFYRNKYDYRLEWLRFVETLSADGNADARDNAVRAVAQIVGSPGGLMLLQDSEGGQLQLRAAWPPSVTAAHCAGVRPECPLVHFLARTQWVVDLREYAVRPALYGDLALPDWLNPAGPWRLVVPLLFGDRFIGALVLASPPEPFDFNFEDRDLLKTVGRHVALQVAQRSADEQLTESRQFDAYNRFAAFVMHDLKNSVAQLQMLVDNAARHGHNPVFFDDAIGTIRNTSERMTRLIEQLQRRDTQGVTRAVELAAAVQAAVLRSQSRRPEVTVSGSLAGVQVQGDPDRLAAVIEHAIRNAQEATPPEGAVRIELQVDGDARITVVDNGQGMDEDFVRHRLFRPFDTTKGVKGMGIGAYQVRQYARDLGGDVEVHTAPGRGTRFCIRLPVWRKTN